MNGFVAAIAMDTGKVLDVEPMSRYCKSCILKEELKKSDPIAYATWKATHQCLVNYQGSAPNMEVTGAQRIFSRSIENNNLRYVEMFSDVDSKTYPAIKETYINCSGDLLGIEVQKKECVGHVQKRVGTRLRKLKRDVKGLGGKGRLSDKIIDRLQNYYGVAVRSNKNDLSGMQRSIMAALCHVASSKEQNWHDNCPKGSDTWCGYQRDIYNKTKLFKAGKGLPKDVFMHVKPIFVELCNETLLKRCLDCKTQNQNEAFNGTVWRRLPKTTCRLSAVSTWLI